MNVQAEYLLGCLKQCRLPEGGLRYADALTRARLDGSLESVARLQKLLVGVHRRDAVTPAQLWRTPDGRNFFLLAAAYVAQTAAQLGGQPLTWLTVQEAQALWPQLEAVRRQPQTWPVARIGKRPCLPLPVVAQLLQGVAPAPDLVDFVRRFAAPERIDTASNAQTDWPSQCRRLHQALRQGHTLPEQLVPAAQLAQLSWDFSLPSIARLDEWLLTLRQHFGWSPSAYNEVAARPKNARFMALCAWYAAQTAARHAHTTLRWLSPAQIEAASGHTLAASFESSLAALIGEHLYFPLLRVKKVLFEETVGPTERLAGFVAHTVSANPGTLRRMNAPAQALPPLPHTWRQALEYSGFLLGQALGRVQDNTTLAPLLLQLTGGRMRFSEPLPPDHPDLGHPEAPLLQANPHGAPFLSLVWETQEFLPGSARTLVLELQTHSGSALHLQLAVPFKIHAERTRVGRLMLCHSSSASAQDGALAQALLTGAERALAGQPGRVVWPERV